MARFSDRTLLVHELSKFPHSSGPPAEDPEIDRAFIGFIRGNKLAYHAYWASIFPTTAAQLEDLLDGRLDDFPDRHLQKEHLLRRLCPPGLEDTDYPRKLVDALYRAAGIVPPRIDELPLTIDERDIIFPALEQFGFYLNDRTLQPQAEVIDYWIRASEPCRDHLSPLVGEIAHVQAMYPDPDELDETLTDWYLHRPLEGWPVWLPRTAAYFTEHIREHDRRRKAEQVQGGEQA